MKRFFNPRGSLLAGAALRSHRWPALALAFALAIGVLVIGMKSAGATDEPFVYDSVLQGLSSCLDTYGIEPAATGILCPAFGLHLLAIEAAPAILSRRV